MFSFLEKVFSKFSKKEEAEESALLVTPKTRCICTLNEFLTQKCSIDFRKEFIILRYETGEMKIYYDTIVSYGQIINSKQGIKDAMDNKILTQSALQSPGFLAGNFYTLTNNAKVFLYIKFKKDEIIHTFLAEYNTGIERALKLLEKKKSMY